MRKYSSLLYGDNCAKWLLEAAQDRDITIVLEHMFNFPDDGAYVIFFKDLNKTTHGCEEYLLTFLKNVKRPYGGNFPVEDIQVESRLEGVSDN
jgi:hypothetical protein